MNPILALENVEVLRQLACCNVLLAFDYDGTLAPIVARREDAVMRPRTQSLFSTLCRLYPCAVISGRSQADAASRIDGANVRYLVGNHGLEPGAGLQSFEAEVAQARPAIEAALGESPGLELEDKRYSLAIHYRRARNKHEARAVIDRAVAATPVRFRKIGGKMVVNLVPESAPDKGQALLRLRAQAGADAALYIGDDVTDEDVFDLDQPGRLLSVRVGESKTSRASYFIRSQREIDRFLEVLIQARGG